MFSLDNSTEGGQPLSIINRERKLLPGPQLLHELISDSSEDSIALDFLLADDARVKLTYNDLRFASHNLAKEIKRQLPRARPPQPIIPVILPQCPELYIAWLAVLQAGAGFCPVSPDTPHERLKFIIRDVSATLVLTLAETLDDISQLLPEIKCLSLSLSGLTSLHAERRHDLSSRHGKLDTEVIASSPAYVMYTSGSTGLPKGVKVSHLSVTQSLLAHNEHIPEFKRFLQFASPTFDVSIFEVFFPFFRGATLVGCERERMLSDLPGVITILDADAAELTPTVAGTLLRSRAAAPCLQTLLTIGEMLTKQVIMEFGGSKEQESMLFAMYGPTEASIHCTTARRLETSASTRSIGHPLSTVTAYILKVTDQSTQVEFAPVGEAGELAIGGQLADGYLNRPEQNDTSFIFIPGHGQIYRTGDRAICRPNGQLEILGRMVAGQVKLRGQRLELGEIEEVASKVSGLHLAIATVIDEVLVLFCAADTTVTKSDVHAVCKSWLPTFMRPGEVILLRDVPRLPSGKVDRKTLEKDFQKLSSSDASDTSEYRNEFEHQIGAVVQQVLSCRLSRETLLWSSGLDSLKAILVASKLRSTFDSVTPGLILESETIADIAEKLSIGEEADSNSQNGSSPRYEDSAEWNDVRIAALEALQVLQISEKVAEFLPCSSMQIGMLTETMRVSELNFNHIRLKCSGEVSIEDLWGTFQLLADHNDVLKSGFVYTGHPGMPFVRVVWPRLERHQLELLHPFEMVASVDDDETVVDLCIHHALYDGWSWELILDDLNAILAKDAPAQRTSFNDFSSYQRFQQALNIEKDLKYWNNLLHGCLESPMPSLVSTRGSGSSRQSVSHNLEFSYSHLASLSQSLRLSRQSYIQAAWALLLSNYTNSEDVVFGAVSSGRHTAVKGIDQIIGPCISALPVRADLSSLDTFHDLLAYIQRQHVHSMDAGHVSLNILQKQRDQSTTRRLFDTLLVWQEGISRSTQKRNLVRTCETSDVLEYPLVLEFQPIADKVFTRATVDTSMIPIEHARLILHQLDAILSYISSNMGSSVRSLWSCPPRGVMSSTNSSFRSFDDSFDLVSAIKQHAAQYPSKPAIRFVRDFDPRTGELDIETLSYSDMFSQALGMSSALIAKHRIEPDDLVCVFTEKSINMYLAILAIIMSGAGYMCIDPRTPQDRIDRILREAKCAAILTHHNVHDHTLNPKSTVINIQGLLNDAAPIPELPTRPNNQNHLAYAVFTSGSTGVPKGVLITRKNLLSNIACLSQIYPCERSQDQLLQACSPAFDVSVFEIFWTWHMGITLCASSNDVLFRDLEKLIDCLNITHLSLTPSVAALVQPDKVPSVKILVTAGEPMNSKVFGAWADHGLYQGYGPSETTNICNIKPAVTLQDAPSNVGPVFPNTSIFICRKQPSAMTQSPPTPLSSSDFQLVPKGAVGEIWIGGDQVGRGYIDHNLTVRNFMDHPEYGRVYRSGDIGRLLANDTLVVLGREDDQVKLRGQRIELGDINTALVSIDFIKDAVSMIISEGDWNARLVSFWIHQEHEDDQEVRPLVSTVYKSLHSSLPSYMVPDVIVPVKTIPLTRQGKVDKKLLSQHFCGLAQQQVEAFARHNGEDGESTALDDTEFKVASILSDVLAIPTNIVRRNTSFYALGLDSINCIQFSRRLVELGFQQIDISKILKYSSISELLPFLTTKHSQSLVAHKAVENNFDPEWESRALTFLTNAGLEVETLAPCTPLQEYMLSCSVLDGFGSYRNTLKFAIKGDLDRLQHAWTIVVKRHQLLRTRFMHRDSVDAPYAQVVLKEIALPWDLESQPEPLTTGTDIIMHAPYTLRTAVGPEDRIELILNVHHALYDAEAMSVLLDEVQIAYRGQELPMVTPFQNYLQYMVDMDLSAVDSFWQKQLKGASPSKLGDAFAATSNALPGRNKTRHLVSELTLNELESHAKHSSTTTLAIVQCALARLLCCFLNMSKVCFGNVFSGRNIPIIGAERIVGPCFNTLPIMAQMMHNTSNQELIYALQKVDIDILPFQPSSLRRIQRQNSVDGGVLFDVLLLLQHDAIDLDESIWCIEDDLGDMSFPYIFEIFPNNKNGTVSLTLHSETADEDLQRQLLCSFDFLLLHTIKYPQARAADYSELLDKIPNIVPGADKWQRRSNDQPKESRTASQEELSPIECQVHEILSRMSTVKSFPITSDITIFRFGLDSINAVQIASQLRKQGYVISGANILEAPSIAGIAAFCARNNTGIAPAQPTFDLIAFDTRHREAVISNSSVMPDTVQSIRPCTSTQCGILSQYLKTGGRLYYNTVRLRLESTVNLDRLRDAWKSATVRHEMLRTGFAEIEDEKFPFAMITFKPEHSRIKWHQKILSTMTIPEQPPKIIQLAEPAWCIEAIPAERGVDLEISMLHALYDAQSLDVILADVSHLYHDDQLVLPASIDSALSTILSSGATEAAKQHWVAMAGTVHLTRFPDLRVCYSDHKTSSVTQKSFSLPLSRITQRCAELESSLQALCQATWSRLLAAYTGQDNVTFGLIVSGRTYQEEISDEVAFPCINTLACPINTSTDNQSLLAQISLKNHDLMKHQHIPLNHIKRWLQVEDDLFDTILVLQRIQSKQRFKVPWSMVEDNASAEYAISLEILPDEDSDTMGLQMTFSEQLIPPEAAEVLTDQFDALLSEMCSIEEMKTAPCNLSILSAKDEQIPTNVQFLHEFVAISSEEHPEKVALEFVTGLDGGDVSKRVYTYRNLELEGNRLANLLIRRGAMTGDLVAICFDKCPEASFAILGILKAGCGYVAIDPGAPADRRRFILEDASCRILLTSIDKVSAFDDFKAINVIAADDCTVFEEMSTERPKPITELSPKDTCYCLYTSGTTGTPKGCLISHNSAVQAMLSFQRIFKGHWDSDSRWLQFASFHFDVSVLEQYWSWSVGICVTSAPRDLLFEDLPGFIKALNITHLDLTPSLARLLHPDDVPSLFRGVFIVGGEQVSQDILEKWGDAGCLYNFYGPSEVTIGCTVRPRVTRNTKATNIGRQWDNVGTFVLKPDSQTPVLRGAVGELCLSGTLVGKGYLNRSDLSKEKFIVLEGTGVRVYRTGDLVRLLYDNSFEFLGRIDDQVKLRGQRLEVGEINQVILGSNSKVKHAATLVLQHPNQKRDQLVAFYSVSGAGRNEQPTFLIQTDTDLLTKIKRHCINKLPGYMVPTCFLMISSMPLSANNKVDHQTLRALYAKAELQELQSSSQVDEPVGVEDVEAAKDIAKIIEQFLHLPSASVKPSSKLFELGLDSISVIGLSRKLRGNGYGNADVAKIMKNSIVVDLAHTLRQSATISSDLTESIHAAKKIIQNFANANRKAILASLNVDDHHLEDISPCTPLQEGMISKVLSNDSVDPLYFMQFNYDISGQVHLDRLRDAWRTVQKSTSILRTHFVPTEDGFAQVVLRDGFEADTNDPVEAENAPTSSEHFREWWMASRSFGERLPWRLRLMHTWGKTYMSLFIFHGLYDGISLNLLLAKVAKTYDEAGQRFDQHSNFYEVLAHGPLLRNPGAKDFWMSSLSRPNLLDLQPKYSAKRKVAPMPKPVRKTLSLSALDQASHQLNITIPAFFHAAWLKILHQRFHINPTLGLVVSGRGLSNEDAENVIGPMFNTIPCSIEGLSDTSNILDLAQACHKFNVDVLPYQQTPLRDIANWTVKDARSGLFDSLLVFQKQRNETYDQVLWRDLPSESAPDYPINLEIEQKTRHTYNMTLVTKVEYLNITDAESLLDDMASLMERIASGDQIELHDAFKNSGHEIKNPAKIKAFDGSSIQDKSQVRHSLSPSAIKIRDQIAKLARIDPTSINLHYPSIFELGLDSIDAMRLATRLKNIGYKISVSKIMQSSTVAGISKIASKIGMKPEMDASFHEATASTQTRTDDLHNKSRQILLSHGFEIEKIQRVLPVTSMQEGLLLDFEKYYNIMAFEIEPETDCQRLLHAWKREAKVNPMLRTKFVEVENPDNNMGYLQVIELASQDAIEQSMQILHHGSISSVIESFKRDAAKNQLCSPAIRITIINAGQDRPCLVIGMPHAAYDAWSLYLLQQNVRKLYHSSEIEDVDSASIIPYESHLETILWQSTGDWTKDFWTRMLRNAQSSLFKGSPDHDNTLLALLVKRRSRMSLPAVAAFCKRRGITVQSLGLACWTLTLAHYLKQNDVCFGLVLSGRTTEGSDQLVFPTFNTVIFRQKIPTSVSRGVFVKNVHDVAMEVSEHQHFPLREAIKLSRCDKPDKEVFNTLFTFQKVPQSSKDLPQIYREASLDDSPPSPPYAVNVEMEGREDQVWWTIASQEGIATRKGVEDLLSSLDQVLWGTIEMPDDEVQQKLGAKTSFCGLRSIKIDTSRTTCPNTGDAAIPIVSRDIETKESWTDVEEDIRSVLARVSKTDAQKIDKKTGIFQLGLDSISAIKVSRLLKIQGLKLPVSQIIKAQTIKNMASVAQRTDGQAIEMLKEPNTQTKIKQEISAEILLQYDIERDDVESMMPATSGQIYMLDMWTSSGERLFYPSFYLDIRGPTKASIEHAIERLAEETPMLRTLFIETSDQVFQVTIKYGKTDKYQLPWTYSASENDEKLLITLKIHHALYDAVSLQIMFSDLERICLAKIGTTSINTSFSAFVSATTALDGTHKQNQQQFWTDYLNPIKDQPSLSKRIALDVARIERYQPRVLEILSLSRILRNHGVSIQALFIAAHARIYAQYRCQLLAETTQKVITFSETVVGMYLANRSLDIDGLTELAAPTFNIVPLKVNIKFPILEAAKKVQDDLSKISYPERCGVSMRDIYEWTGVVIDCFVNFLKLPEEEQSEKESSSGGISIEHANLTTWRPEESGDLACPSPFVNGHTEGRRIGWCLPSIDIEAKVENGYLGVGVFAPSNMLNEQAVDNLYTEIRKILSSMLEEANE